MAEARGYTQTYFRQTEEFNDAVQTDLLVVKHDGSEQTLCPMIDEVIRWFALDVVDGQETERTLNGAVLLRFRFPAPRN